MAGYFILGTLAAFGLLSLLWVIFGWLLPGGRGFALVCWGTPDEGILSRYRWLYGVGLLRCPLLVVSGEKKTGADTEIDTGEALLARLEWERNQVHGTGIGDPAGRYQRCGISEL